MSVPTNTFEGAQRHVSMLPMNHSFRLSLQQSLDKLNDGTLDEGYIEANCENISSAAIGIIQEMIREGYNPSVVLRKKTCSNG